MTKVLENNIQLRKICQRPDSFHRFFSLPITRFILNFDLMTPIQVTFVDFFIGLIGIVLFFIGGDWFFLFGVIFLELFEIFDCVDGEVARYLIHKKRLKRTKEEIRVNEFIQDIVHPILQPLIYLGFGYGLYRGIRLPIILIISYIAAIGTSVDTYINTIREKLIGSSGIKNVSRAYKEMKTKSEKILRLIPFGQTIVEIITFITPIPGVIAVINLAIILDFIFFPNFSSIFTLYSFPFNFKTISLIFYAFIQQLLWLMNAKQSITYLQKK